MCSFRLAFRSMMLLISASAAINAADWPTHHGDAARTGGSDEALKFPLAPAWSHRANHPPSPSFRFKHIKAGFIPVITHDFADQVIAAGGRIYYASSSEEGVVCLDQKTGKRLWTFTCDAAVRLAPTWAAGPSTGSGQGKVYFGSDDGHAYCVDGESGKLLWKYTPVQRQRWAINSGRFMSQWPVRSGVAVDGGVAYFAAGMFPPHGVHICAVNAETGDVVWKKTYGINQSTAFQGHITIDGDTLYLPTGRTSPVEINKRDGALLRDSVFKEDDAFGYRRSGGGVEVTAFGNDVVAYGPNQLGRMNLRTTLEEWPMKKGDSAKPRGMITGIWAQRIVPGRESVFVLRTYRAGEKRGMKNELIAARRDAFLEAMTARSRISYKVGWIQGDEDLWNTILRKVKKPYTKIHKLIDETAGWRTDVPDDSVSMIRAGDAVIVGGKDVVTAYATATGQKRWSAEVKGEVWSLAVAGGDLLASTDAGMIYCFRADAAVEPLVHEPVVAVPFKDDAAYRHVAETALAQTDRRQGFCLVLDADEGQLAYEIARKSKFFVIGLEADAAKVAKARRNLTAAGLYGKRVVIHHCPPEKVREYPAYFANLIVADACVKAGDGVEITYKPQDIFRMLRPYGGVFVVGRNQQDKDWQWHVEGGWAKGGIPGWHAIKDLPGYGMVERGELPGAGNWSHMYADTANTGNSGDALVTGVDYDLQWMGAPGNERIINRHMTPMGPLYMNGRMFVFGYNYISVVDAYNGTYLWEKEIPDSSRILMALNASPICVDERYFYSVSGSECWVMDVRNGDVVRKLKSPREKDDWGFIASTGTHIVATNQNPKARLARKNGRWDYALLHSFAPLRKAKRGSDKPLVHDATTRPVVGDVLFVLDAETHERIWTREKGIILQSSIAISEGVIYFAECRDKELRAHDSGHVPLREFVHRDAWFVAVDLKTGRQLWERPVELKDQATTALYLIKAKPNVLLLTTGFARMEMAPPKAGTQGPAKLTPRTCYLIRTMDPATGKTRTDTVYAGPLGVLSNETNHNQYLMHANIIDNKAMMNFYPGPMGVFDLTTGKEESFNPGTRRCSPMTASLTNGFYRAGYSSTYDFRTGKKAPVTRITRPSCWISILPAGGLVLMPEYGSTSCRCGYPIQTSVVMAPAEPRSAEPQPEQ